MPCRRFGQTGALYLQATRRGFLYAAVMFGTDTSATSVGDYEARSRYRTNGRVLPTATSHRSECTWKIRHLIVRVRRALVSTRLDDAAELMSQLSRQLNNHSGAAFEPYRCAGRLLEACSLALEDDLPEARDALTSAVFASDDTLAATILRYIGWRCGEGKEIYASDTVDYLTIPVGGKAIGRIVSLCVSAALAFDRLQLIASANLATEALQLARLRYGALSPMSCFPATLLAQVAYEQGRLEEAEALLRPRLAVIRASGMVECVARASVLLARLNLHRGRHAVALSLLRETEALGRVRGWPRLACIASAEYTRALEILRNDERHTKTAHAAKRPMSLRSGQFAARVGADAASIIGESPSFCAVETGLRRICEAATQTSVESTFDLLLPWLRLGASRGLLMVFKDTGAPLMSMLERFYYALPTHDARLSDLRPYLATLLRSTLEPSSETSSLASCRPLSRRETGILQMIAHGMSNKHIAQSLGIAPETVKSHAKRIFVKLSTRTRAQAVARAEAIGFL